MIVRVCSIESPRSTAAATLSSGDTVALERRPTRPASEGSDGSEPPKALDPRSSLSSIAIAIGDVICEGGMGVVRTAIQRSLARTVAIKTTFPDATAKEAERMLQEAWVTGFLEHPGVVPVHDILRGEDGAPVVVMRRIRGATWEQRRDDAEWARAQGARDLLEQNLRIFVRVCEVVEFAHAKGVIHRDIKPANVMLGSFGEVYLLDWGLALAIGEEAAQHLPRAGLSRELTGTLAYAAPETIGAIDVPLAEHTDVYLLGAVLFELATGRPPHDKPTVTLTFESIASSPALGARGRSGPPRSDLRARAMEKQRLRARRHRGRARPRIAARRVRRRRYATANLRSLRRVPLCLQRSAAHVAGERDGAEGARARRHARPRA